MMSMKDGVQSGTPVAPARDRGKARTIALAIATVASVVPAPASHLERHPASPLIAAATFAAAGVEADGRNINGPSLLRISEAVPPERRADPRARYYLYFADHGGKYIRLAWAAELTGPYTLYRPGRGVLSLFDAPGEPAGDGDNHVLPLSPTLAVGGHIASPDVHFDERRGEFVMVFHGFPFRRGVGEEGWGIDRSGQSSFVARSPDGLDFNRDLGPVALGRPYLRVFWWEGRRYASAFSGLFRSTDHDDWFAPFEQIPVEVPALARARHTAVRPLDDALDIFYTERGVAPEHLRVVRVYPADDPVKWRIGEDRAVLEPETSWEGGDLPLTTSRSGRAAEPERALRDPAYWREPDNSEWIIYAIAGEQGLALARLGQSEAAPWRPAAPPSADAERFVPLRGGTYLAGDLIVRPDLPPGGPAVPLNTPGAELSAERVVRAVDDFEIGQTPVTNAEYARYVEATGAPAPTHWPEGRPEAGTRHDPVVFVNRYEAEAYARWLTAETGRIHRLPTRGEFEYAARGGLTGRRYPWGDAEPAGRANFSAQAPRPADAWRDHLRPVASYPPNGYGLYDLAGNVWQWVVEGEDPATSRYKYRVVDPAEVERAVMGGSWRQDAAFLRAGTRVSFAPGLRQPDIGFRVVREPAGGAASFHPSERRLVALRQSDGTVALSWQPAPDEAGAGFHVYRSDARFEAGRRITTEPVAGGSWIDPAPGTGRMNYRVRPVGPGGEAGRPTPWQASTNEAGDVAMAFHPADRPGGYVPVFGDLDGDGRLDGVLRFDSGFAEMAPDPGRWMELEAYGSGGRFLWRRPLSGHEVARGNPNNVPVLVYDLDGDGRAEVVCRLQEGEEAVLAVLDGMTGEVRRRVPWPLLLTDFARSSSRIHLAVAYLDGRSPAIIVQTGLYENERVNAYDAALRPLWEHRGTGATGGSGSHRIEVADLDGDGRDEVVIGSTCLEPDGRVRWSTYWQHADHAIIRDFLPERPGREIFYAIETPIFAGAYLVDGATGESLWARNRQTDPRWIHSHSAWAADVDPATAGIECYVDRNRGRGHVLLSARGELLRDPFPGYRDWPLEWDPQNPGRELVERRSGVLGRMENGEWIAAARQPDLAGVTGSVVMVADVVGDGRDEMVIVGERAGRRGLFVITSTHPVAGVRPSPTFDREYRLWLSRNLGAGYGSYAEPSAP